MKFWSAEIIKHLDTNMQIFHKQAVDLEHGFSRPDKGLCSVADSFSNDADSEDENSKLQLLPTTSDGLTLAWPSFRGSGFRRN